MPTADFLTADPTLLSAQIVETATRLKALTQRSQQADWHQAQVALSLADVLREDTWRQWAIAPLNDRDQVAWPRGKQPLWLCQQITVPESLAGFALAGLSLRLGLTWWANAAAIYVNGELVQAGDIFDCSTRLVLSDRVMPGDTFTVALHLLSPGHDDGALVRSEVIYESADPATPEPAFVADELLVLKTYAEKLAPEKLRDIVAAIAPLDWSVVSQSHRFQAELAALRQRLFPLSDWLKQYQIGCVGHAHLDLAWLWPVAATWQAAERTFRSVLALQADFPELTYTHSSPALFDWLETHQPQLFQQILQAVQAGAWAIDAGLWVEPELNTISGESLARQLLYGQRYARSRFGRESAIAWLPDSFGFSWQMPQALKLGRVEVFATQKLRWNEATEFPHRLFAWEGLDGTRLLSLTLPPIGTDIDPVQMATHSADWVAKTGHTEMLWLPGVGDHGGGPTRDMLEKARRWAHSPFFPDLSFTSVVEHLQRLASSQATAPLPTKSPPAAEIAPEPVGEFAYPESLVGLTAAPELPVWRDELYLELHRGCYTVHADQKWFNHRCTEALREAEMFAAIAHMGGQFTYPQAALETAWKQVLFNQFHDILPGTAIPAVFETVNPAWQSAYDVAKGIRAAALRAIAQCLSPAAAPAPDAIPVYLFNSLSWERTDLVEIPLADLPTDGERWGVFDPVAAQWLPSQLSDHTDQTDSAPCASDAAAADLAPRLLVLATVPAIGYRLVWLVPDPEPAPATAFQRPDAGAFQLENEFVRGVIDPATGAVVELWDTTTQTNAVRSPANQLQAFRDAGQYWDAWDIAPDYAAHPLPTAQLQSMQWLERGPLRQRLRVVRTIADSTIQQDYVLDAHLPYLKVATVADWHATQVVLKAAFPLNVVAEFATYEIPFGAIARPTNPTDPHERAKWEVPALRWADLSDGQRGLSVLTDYKHGFDAQPDQLRLTLLKAPLWPDPQADRGRHRFTYGLYPHAGDWRAASTPNWAIAFGTEVRAVIGPPGLPPQPSTGPSREREPSASFLNIGTDRVQVSALKLAEDASDRYILRCWDLYGQGATLALAGIDFERTDFLEAAIAVDVPEQLTPWQIATLKLTAVVNESLSPAAVAESQA